MINFPTLQEARLSVLNSGTVLVGGQLFTLDPLVWDGSGHLAIWSTQTQGMQVTVDLVILLQEATIWVYKAQFDVPAKCSTASGFFVEHLNLLTITFYMRT